MFDCGVEELNNYLRERAGQDMRNHYASVFVAVSPTGKKVLGYYTLSNASIRLAALPHSLAQKLPKYPDVPAIRIGRLAVDCLKQGQGLGAALLADAAIRCVTNVPAWAALVVDAKDAGAVRFYQKFGFTSLPEGDRHLFLMRTSLTDFLTPSHNP
jgi:ribosomal protein S18 acetylase RimI-like enzyme